MFRLEAFNMAGVMIQTRDLILGTMVESMKTIEADAYNLIVCRMVAADNFIEGGRGMAVAVGCFLA